MALDVNIGEFVEFGDGVMAAELTGASVDNLAARLGTRPPFREPGEGDELDFRTGMEARRLAFAATRATDIVEPVREANSEIDSVVMSKMGGLVLMGGDPDQVRESIGLAKELSGGYEMVVMSTQVISIG